jgi:hypothetical protein
MFVSEPIGETTLRPLRLEKFLPQTNNVAGSSRGMAQTGWHGGYRNRRRDTLPYPVYVTKNKHWSLGVRDPGLPGQARPSRLT